MKRSNTEEFIKKAIEVHGDKYDYSKVDYSNIKKNVLIHCKKCNHDFYKQPYIHIKRKSGCQKCHYKKKKSNTEEFIKKAIEIHGDKYDYSKVNYTSNKKNVLIHCKKCKKNYNQRPDSHLLGKSCPSCSKSGYKEEKKGKLYYIIIQNKKDYLFKIGITNNDVNTRYSKTDKKKFLFYKEWCFKDGSIPKKIEKIFLNKYKTKYKDKYKDILKNGYTEIFNKNIYSELKRHIKDNNYICKEKNFELYKG